MTEPVSRPPLPRSEIVPMHFVDRPVIPVKELRLALTMLETRGVQFGGSRLGSGDGDFEKQVTYDGTDVSHVCAMIQRALEVIDVIEET